MIDDPADGIRKRFGANEVLRGVSLTRRQGRGGGGDRPRLGKSTFLRCLNHLETIDAGRNRLEGDTSPTTTLVAARCVADAEVRRTVRDWHGVPALQPVPTTTVLENVIEAPITVSGPARAHPS